MNKDRTCGADDAELTQARSPDVHGWQPISTAPRDDTPVLLWAESWEMSWGIQIGHFLEAEQCWVTSEGTVDDNDDDFDPTAESEDFDDDTNLGPTHWMPLPSPPVQS
jgi:hypothetical protein